MAGIPLVASEVEPYKMVIEDGENGIIVGDSSKWREKIEGVLGGKINGKVLVENARKSLACNYSIKNTAETWREVLGVL